MASRDETTEERAAAASEAAAKRDEPEHAAASPQDEAAAQPEGAESDAAQPHVEASDPAEGAGEADEGAAVEKDLDELVADLRRERDEYLELAKRARADFENFRRRATKETADAERRGKADVVRALLPAIDSLERALLAAGVTDGEPAEDGEEPQSREVSAHEALAEGVALVHRELTAALGSVGVEAFDPIGERFDPNSCEALSTRPAADGEEAGVVVETVQRGYRIGETLIRPARVVVSG
ncbi:MAG TPA: nucleotide exchange factor GrpE [Solirubrobacterales bacterium]|jgi:molecular chaperone GrpE